jgi:hypothetical protein
MFFYLGQVLVSGCFFDISVLFFCLKFSFLGAFTKFPKAAISFVMSVRLPAWNNSAPTKRILMKFDI